MQIPPRQLCDSTAVRQAIDRDDLHFDRARDRWTSVRAACIALRRGDDPPRGDSDARARGDARRRRGIAVLVVVARVAAPGATLPFVMS